MNNIPTASFPESEENKDERRSKPTPCFTIDVPIVLPDGRVGTIPGVTSESRFSSLLEDNSLDNVINSGIHLGSIVDNEGRQLLSDIEISEVYQEKQPAIVFLDYISPAYSEQSSEPSVLDVSSSTIPELPALQIPASLNQALPASFKMGLPSPGILPPEAIQNNPYIIRAKDVDIASLISEYSS